MDAGSTGLGFQTRHAPDPVKNPAPYLRCWVTAIEARDWLIIWRSGHGYIDYIFNPRVVVFDARHRHSEQNDQQSLGARVQPK